MYHCNECRKYFTITKRIDDTEGDESYDVCPRCGSDDYQTITNENDEEND